MTTDPSFFVKKIRHLTQALVISGALNIGILTFSLIWILREQPPTPYCELKPATASQEQLTLVDGRNCQEVLSHLSRLPFHELCSHLEKIQLIEDGYAERDLALACLVAFYHFDFERALPQIMHPKQKRLLGWKAKEKQEPIVLTVYPDLTTKQFDLLIKFAKIERWPFNSQGLFNLLKKQKKQSQMDSELAETFMHTPEFWTVELLFKRADNGDDRSSLLAIILEGSWNMLKEFTLHQKQIHDQTDARRRKFLLDYLSQNSLSATLWLLKNDWEFTTKKLDDATILTILNLLPIDEPLGEKFAKEILVSPRNSDIRKKSSEWLYRHAGEKPPQTWSYQADLTRFMPAFQPLNQLDNRGVKPPTIEEKVLKKIPLDLPKKTLNDSLLVKKVTKSISQPIKINFYTVQEKDSLWKISKKFGTTPEKIQRFNQLQTDKIKPGMVLKIPQ